MHIKCDYKVINRIINERSNVTTDIVTKLSMAFETTPDFWLNSQMAVDFYGKPINLNAKLNH